MNPPYSPLAVANYFIKLSLERKLPLTPLKLQKLVYFAHGWYLAQFHKPLINESVQAWQFGPVIQSLYHRFKKYGNQPITALESDTTFVHFKENDKDVVIPMYNTPMVNDDDKETQEFLNFIWEAYGNADAAKLTALTHLKNAPWDKAVEQSKIENGFLPQNKEIENKLIEEYFKKLLAELSNDAVPV